jgi:hypothetical protein
MQLAFLWSKTKLTADSLVNVLTFGVRHSGNWKARMTSWVLDCFWLLDYIFIFFSLGEICNVWLLKMDRVLTEYDMWTLAMEDNPRWPGLLGKLTIEVLLTPSVL